MSLLYSLPLAADSNPLVPNGGESVIMTLLALGALASTALMIFALITVLKAPYLSTTEKIAGAALSLAFPVVGSLVTIVLVRQRGAERSTPPVIP